MLFEMVGARVAEQRAYCVTFNALNSHTAAELAPDSPRTPIKPPPCYSPRCERLRRGHRGSEQFEPRNAIQVMKYGECAA